MPMSMHARSFGEFPLRSLDPAHRTFTGWYGASSARLLGRGDVKKHFQYRYSPTFKQGCPQNHGVLRRRL